MMSLLLWLLPSAALYTLTIWPFGPPLPQSLLRWRQYKELYFDWSAGLSTGVFLLIRANVRPPSSQWIPTKLIASPSPLQSHSNFSCRHLRPHSIFAKDQVFPSSQGVTLYLCFLMGPPLISLSLLYKAFLRPLHACASPKWFPFLNVTNVTKLKRLYCAVSRAISSCLSSSPIRLLLSETSLFFLQVTLTHFALSYERTLGLPTSFSILGLARLGVKPRLCRSSWRALASTHPLMLPSTSPREALLACPPSLPWNLPSFTAESTLSSPCFRSDPPLPHQGAALAHFDSLPLMIWADGPVLFPFKVAFANCLLWH